MRELKSSSSGEVYARTEPLPDEARRRFLRGVGGAAAAAVAAGTICLGPLAEKAASVPQPWNHGHDGGEGERAERSYDIREDVARRERDLRIPDNDDNGDEKRYHNRIGNYSKGLLHDNLGVVQPFAYDALLDAVREEDAVAFDQIPLGGTILLVNPQAGLTFDLEGTDSHKLFMQPSPAFASAERASEAVECYWMALLRDVNFTAYGTHSAVSEACAELSSMNDFRGPKVSGKVAPATLFRGFTPGDLIGPYVSQFLLQPMNYGAIPLTQLINTYLPLTGGGTDHLTDAASWLAAQNGQGPFGKNRIDTFAPRHIRNGRDLSAYVHADPPFQAFFNACLWMNDKKVTLNPGNPYAGSHSQSGFVTFGFPHIEALLGEVCTRALKAVWYQKWFVHRALRPEEYGGHLHFMLTGAANYPLHLEALNSKAVAQVFKNNGTYFLPQAYPEGCPQHPSYAQGHGSLVGAGVTLLKAFFDETQPFTKFANVMQANEDGLSLVQYTASDAGQLSIGSELNKLAGNIGMGRNHAGIHWRSDYVDALLLGEAVTISVLRDQRATYTEDFHGFTFTKFDGTTITV